MNAENKAKFRQNISDCWKNGHYDLHLSDVDMACILADILKDMLRRPNE